MPEIVDKGAITNGKFSNLSPASKYYIILFGVDPANGYKANSDVVKKEASNDFNILGNKNRLFETDFKFGFKLQ